VSDPHANGPIRVAGAPPEAAEAALVLCHGRGDSATRFLRLADDFHRRGVLYLAPEASGKAWYAGPASEPPEAKAPYLESAFSLVERAVRMAEDAGVPPEKVAFMGFSQGATVAAEYVATNPRRYGGLAALAGGLPGPDPAEMEHDGDLRGTPVYLGAGEDDDRFDAERVGKSAETFRRLGAGVTAEAHPELGHAVNDAEVNAVGRILDSVL